MKKITVAAAALVKDNKIFIAKRPADKLPALVWEFPGGKPELGETLPQTLYRELKEELHVETIIGNFIAQTSFTYDFAEVEINLFWAKLKDDNAQIIDNEHPQTAWITIDEMDNYQFAEADIALIEKLKTIGINPLK